MPPPDYADAKLGYADAKISATRQRKPGSTSSPESSSLAVKVLMLAAER